MAPATRTDALALAADRLAGDAAALELEAAELADRGHPIAAHRAATDAVAAGYAAEAALEELVELEAERLLVDAHRALAGILDKR